MNSRTPGRIRKLPIADVVTTFARFNTSDTALATRALGGTQIGGAINNVRIPTRGVVRLTILVAEFDETGAAAAAEVAFAILVGSTTIWATTDNNAGTSADVTVRIDTGATSRLIGAGTDDDQSGVGAKIMSFDIVGDSIPTGLQDFEVRMGDEANGTTGAATITGTTVISRWLVEIISATTRG